MVEYKKIARVGAGSSAVLIVTFLIATSFLSVGDIRQLLSDNPLDNVILVSPNSFTNNQAVLLGRSPDPSIEFVKWKYKDFSLTMYNGSSRIIGWKPRIYYGTRLMWTKWFSVEKMNLSYDSESVNITQDYQVFYPYDWSKTANITVTYSVLPFLAKPNVLISSDSLPDELHVEFEPIFYNHADGVRIKINLSETNNLSYEDVSLTWGEDNIIPKSFNKYGNGKGRITYPRGEYNVDPTIRIGGLKITTSLIKKDIGVGRVYNTKINGGDIPLLINPSKDIVVSKDYLNKIYTFVANKERLNVKELVIEFGVNTSYNLTFEKRVFDYWDNFTVLKIYDLNQSALTYNVTIEHWNVSFYNVTRWRYEYKKLEVGDVISSNNNDVINYRGKWKAKTGSRYVDLIPTFNGFSMKEYAQWNVSYAFADSMVVNNTGGVDVDSVFKMVSFDTSSLVGAGKLDGNGACLNLIDGNDDITDIEWKWNNYTDSLDGFNSTESKIILITDTWGNDSKRVDFYYDVDCDGGTPNNVSFFTDTDYILISAFTEAQNGTPTVADFSVVGASASSNSIQYTREMTDGWNLKINAVGDFVNYPDVIAYSPTNLSLWSSMNYVAPGAGVGVFTKGNVGIYEWTVRATASGLFSVIWRASGANYLSTAATDYSGSDITYGFALQGDGDINLTDYINGTLSGYDDIPGGLRGGDGSASIRINKRLDGANGLTTARYSLLIMSNTTKSSDWFVEMDNYDVYTFLGEETFEQALNVDLAINSVNNSNFSTNFIVFNFTIVQNDTGTIRVKLIVNDAEVKVNDSVLNNTATIFNVSVEDLDLGSLTWGINITSVDGEIGYNLSDFFVYNIARIESFCFTQFNGECNRTNQVNGTLMFNLNISSGNNYFDFYNDSGDGSSFAELVAEFYDSYNGASTNLVKWRNPIGSGTASQSDGYLKLLGTGSGEFGLINRRAINASKDLYMQSYSNEIDSGINDFYGFGITNSTDTLFQSIPHEVSFQSYIFSDVFRILINGTMNSTTGLDTAIFRKYQLLLNGSARLTVNDTFELVYLNDQYNRTVEYFVEKYMSPPSGTDYFVNSSYILLRTHLDNNPNITITLTYTNASYIRVNISSDYDYDLNNYQVLIDNFNLSGGISFDRFLFSSAEIILNKPDDDDIFALSTLNFNFTAIHDNNNSMIANLYLDGVLNQTNNSVFNNTLTNFEVTGLTNGVHTWYIEVTTGEGVNTSETRTVNIDLQVPKIFWTAPLNNTYTSSTSLFFYGNYTDDFNNSANFSIFQDNVLNQSNVSAFNNTNTSFQIIGIVEGNRTFYFNVTDLFGSNNTDAFRIIFDYTNPSLNYTDSEFANNSYTKNQNFTWNVSDLNLLYVIFSNDSGSNNFTFRYNNSPSSGQYSNDLTSWAEGIVQVDVWAFDAANNINYSTINFTFDITLPSDIVYNGTNNSVVGSSYLLAEFNVTEINIDNSTLTWINSSGTFNHSMQQDLYIGVIYNVTFNVTNLEDGAQRFFITTFDKAGNVNISDVYYLIIETQLPNFDVLLQDRNGNPDFREDVWASGQALASHQVDWIYLESNASGSDVNYTVIINAASSNYSVNFTILNTNFSADEVYFWRIWANNSVGWNFSSKQIFIARNFTTFLQFLNNGTNYDISVDRPGFIWNISLSSGTFEPQNQTSTIPVWNITNPHSFNIGIYFYLNQSTDFCTSTYWNNEYNTSSYILVDTTRTNVFNLSGSEYIPIWRWIVLNNSCSPGVSIDWTIDFEVWSQGEGGS